MDGGGIGGPRDHAIEGVYLAHQMPLAQAANRRVAAHRANGIKVETDQRNTRTHPRRNGRCLATGMPAAYHDDVELMHEVSPSGEGRRGQKLRGEV